MTQPISYEHAPVGPWDADRSHLKTLAICHYVWGGISIAFSSIFIIHFVMGVMIVSGAMPFGPPAGAPGRPAAPGPPPQAFGWVFVGMGSCLVLLGWTTG